MKISKERQKAIDILNLVEDHLEKNKAKPLNKDSEKSIINGKDYYTLEDKITELLEDK